MKIGILDEKIGYILVGKTTCRIVIKTQIDGVFKLLTQNLAHIETFTCLTSPLDGDYGAILDFHEGIFKD